MLKAKITTTLALTLLTIMLSGSAAFAADFYVSPPPAGDDATGTGALAAPWATIQHAIDSVTSGNTIHITTGTYVEDLIVDKENLELVSTGTVTIQGVSVLDKALLPLLAPNIDILTSGVNIHGFTIQSADIPTTGYATMMLIDGQNVEIHDNDFVSSGSGAARCYIIQTYWDSALGYPSNIDGLHIHDNIFDGAFYYGITIGHTLTAAGAVTIENNTMLGVAAQGVVTRRSNTIIDNNLFFKSALNIGGGITVQGPTFEPQTDIQVTNNTITGAVPTSRYYYGIDIGSGGATPLAMSNILVTGNTISQTSFSGVRVNSAADQITLTANNIAGNLGEGVDNLDPANTLDAPANWWGSYAGPGGIDGGGRLGDTILGLVTTGAITLGQYGADSDGDTLDDSVDPDDDNDGYDDTLEVAANTDPLTPNGPAATVWVDDDWAGSSIGQIVGGHAFGYHAFATIQAGIDGVTTGGLSSSNTVNVAAGTFNEQLIIGNSLTLTGSGGGATVLTGAGVGIGMNINDSDPWANPVAQISSFTIQNFGIGINVDYPGAVGVIQDCNITSNSVSGVSTTMLAVWSSVAQNTWWGSYAGPGATDGGGRTGDLALGWVITLPISLGEFGIDSDGDTQNDNLDPDDDNDGISDAAEVAINTDPLSATPPPTALFVDDDWAGSAQGQSVAGHIFGYDAFDVIQDALDIAPTSAVVTVLDGTYVEDLTVNAENLELLSSGTATIKGVAVVDWPPPLVLAPNIDILTSGVSLHGFTIESPDVPTTGASSGLLIDGQNVDIYDNDFVSVGGRSFVIQTYEDNDLGYASNIDGLHIHDNTFDGDGYWGIIINHTLTSTGAVTVTSNTFTGSAYSGVRTERSNTIIDSNIIRPTTDIGDGITVADGGGRLQTDVWVTNNYITFFIPPPATPPLFQWCMIIGGSGQPMSNIVVTSNTLIDADYIGVEVRSAADQITLTGNNITGHRWGVDNNDPAGVGLDARGNWWGSYAGPGATDGGGRTGDVASGFIITDPVTLGEYGPDFDGDSQPDWLDLDDDNDSARDADEVAAGTDPLDANVWPARIRLAPPTVNFGVLGVNAPPAGPLFVNVFNDGFSTLTLSGASLTGDAADFSHTAPGAAILAAGTSLTFSVFFDPLLGGPRAADLVLTTSDANNPTTSVALLGAGLDIIYVNDDAPAGGDGASWATAFNAIQTGIDSAVTSGAIRVWVAEGRYSESIVPASFIEVYGGFAGTETALSQRDVTTHQSVIDASAANAGAPALHAAVMDALTSAVLDGLVLTGGDANGAALNDATGGGLVCNALDATNRVANCTIRGNSADYGGGVGCVNGTTIVLDHCTIAGNTATTGGGVHFELSNAAIQSGVIAGNQAQTGGGLSCSLSAPQIVNTIISGNTANQGAGISCQANSAPAIINCTIDGNSANTGSGVYLINSSTPSIINSIFSRNSGGVIYEADAGSDPTLAYNMFSNNPDGIYYDDDTSTTYNTTVNLDANVPEADENFIGLPGYVMDGPRRIAGQWDAAAGVTFDIATSQTRLTDSSASLTTGALAGRILLPDVSQLLQRPIVTNTGNTIWLDGDLTALIPNGATYVIADYHLLLFSSALDRGTSVGAPAVDFEGDSRPADLAGVGLDGPGQGYDVGADEVSAGLVVDPTMLPFGSWEVDNGPTTQTIDIFNSSINPIDIIDLLITGPQATHFGFVWPSAPPGSPTTIAGGTTITVEVFFDPSSFGNKNATLTIVSDDGIAVSADTTVFIFGLALDQEIDVAPPSLDLFLDLDAGPSVAGDIVIENLGNADLSFTSGPIRLENDTDGWFAITNAPALTPITPGTSRTVQITFTPAATGVRTVDLVLETDDTDEALTRIPIRGFAFRASQLTAAYVDTDAPAGGNGLFWNQAFNSIQDGIDSAQANGLAEVWVAEGTYFERLTMRSGVRVYGGFRAIELLRDERDIIQAPTTIHGIWAGRTVTFTQTTGARLDGFTVTGGNSSFGGGLFCSLADASNEVRDCTITGNNAQGGGGIMCDASGMRFTSCTITANSAGLLGGGVYATSCTATFTYCNIEGNTSLFDGGGAYLSQDNSILQFCTISGNATNNFHGGGLYLDNSRARIIATTITANTATDSGGGIYLTNLSAPRIVNSTIAGNHAASLFNSPGGGGICAINAFPVLDRCTIAGNTALQGGGCYFEGGQAYLFNQVISGNWSYYEGGAMYLDATWPTLGNCTISRNSSDFVAGGLFLINGAIPRLRNTILEGNTQYAVYEADAISDPSVFDFSLFYNNPDGDYFDEGTTAYTGAADLMAFALFGRTILDGDPQFAMSPTGAWSDPPLYNPATNRTTLTDTAGGLANDAIVGRILNPNDSQLRQTPILSRNGSTIEVAGNVTAFTHAGDGYMLIDYRLLFGSACVDAGYSTGAPSNDRDNHPRPIDIASVGIDGGTTGTYDIGAYEAQVMTGLHFDQLAIDFGEWDIGSGPSAPRIIFVENRGFQPLWFGGPNLLGLDAADFSTSGTFGPSGWLNPGVRLTIEVTFDPTTEGPKTAFLEIQTTDAALPLIRIPLTGVGFEERLSVPRRHWMLYR